MDCKQQFIRNTNGVLAQIKRTGQSRAGDCLQAVQQAASVHNYCSCLLVQCLLGFIRLTRLQCFQHWVPEWTCTVHLGSGRRCLSWDPAPSRCVVVGQSRTPAGRAQAGCWCSRTAPSSQTQPSCRPCGGQRPVCRLAAIFHPLFSNLKKIERFLNEHVLRLLMIPVWQSMALWYAFTRPKLQYETEPTPAANYHLISRAISRRLYPISLIAYDGCWGDFDSSQLMT